MEVQTYIEYEYYDHIMKVIQTRDYFEALSLFEDGLSVWERHVTITLPSSYVSTFEKVSLRWHKWHNILHTANNLTFSGV